MDSYANIAAALLITVSDASVASRTTLNEQLQRLAQQNCAVRLVVVIRGEVELQLDCPKEVSVHFLRVPLETSLSRARNVALRYADEQGLLQQCQVVGFPDDDCIYPEELLGSVIELFASSISQVICGAYAPSREELDSERFPPRRVELTPRLILPLCCSGAMFVTPEVVTAIGAFDERFGLGARFGAAEDADYIIRAVSAGFRGLYAPDAVFVHHPYKVGRPLDYYEGSVAALAKHAPARPRLSLSLVHRLLVGVRLVVNGDLRPAQYVRALWGALEVCLHRGSRAPGDPMSAVSAPLLGGRHRRGSAAGVVSSGLLVAGLTRTALSLMAATMTTAVLGLVFWAVAARLYPAKVVGIDAALISAMVTLSTVCQLNLGNVIIRFLPRVRDRIGTRVLSAYVVAVGASLIAGATFVTVAPALSSHFRFFTSSTDLTVAFVLGLAAWTIFSLQDAALTALGRATWLPIENGAFSVAKIAILPLALVALRASGHGVFLAWVIPMWITVPVINWLIARRVVPAARAAQRSRSALAPLGRRRLVAFVGQDLVGTVLGQVTVAAIPLVVVASVGAKANAYFFLPFTLVTTFDLLFLGVTTAITAAGARAEDRIGWLVRTAIRRFLSLQVPIVVMVILLAPLLLRPFGAAYVHHGVVPLRLLIGASCCRSILFLFVSVARVKRRGVILLVVEASTALLLIALVIAAAPRWGIDGVAAAWLIVHVAFAIGVLPLIVRVVRSRVSSAQAATDIGLAPEAAR